MTAETSTSSKNYRRFGITPPYLSGPPIGTHEQIKANSAIERGSQSLAKALTTYQRSRLRQQISRDDGMNGRRNDAANCTTLTVIPINRPCPVERRPAVPLDTRPPAPSRNPCPRCATRGDLGCAHFAPFEPGPPPKAERYPSMERHR